MKTKMIIENEWLCITNKSGNYFSRVIYDYMKQDPEMRPVLEEIDGYLT